MFNGATFWEQVEQTMQTGLEQMLKPEGCTCDPPARAVFITHDEADLIVDPRCLAHATLKMSGSVSVDTPLSRTWDKTPTVSIDEWEGTKR